MTYKEILKLREGAHVVSVNTETCMAVRLREGFTLTTILPERKLLIQCYSERRTFCGRTRSRMCSLPGKVGRCDRMKAVMLEPGREARALDIPHTLKARQQAVGGTSAIYPMKGVSAALGVRRRRAAQAPPLQPHGRAGGVYLWPLLHLRGGRRKLRRSARKHWLNAL